ncbi:FAD binding domain of DNA photolyase domain-containing protein [Besnoitia besnoiti]|uniref:Deoxyribodipyrimidine photo-lyase n=1 Tax=Besnoitia besnoiti TaxID=94643 RepID=A0A2A9MDN3_BESBE|nr:FAD binding domain of DNA photolyase domain-containing protein [Besnoitia besnoiti]PFH35989.1 FAD binding domain of DNA photolyase domain-containing protein [Besnoitia besnoiti]
MPHPTHVSPPRKAAVQPVKELKRSASAEIGQKPEKRTKRSASVAEEANIVAGGKRNWLKDGSVDERRIRLLTKEVEEPKADGKVVICYLQRDLRVQDNWALLLAQEAALSLKKPLIVIHLLVPGLAFYPSRRHLSFFMGGAREVEEDLKALNIGFELPIVASKDPKKRLEEANEKIEEVFATLQPALAVCDFNPLRLPVQVTEALTRVYAEGLSPLYQVDTHGVVPCWVTSNKMETAARTLRPKLQKLMKEFMLPCPPVKFHPIPWTSKKLFPLDEQRVMSTLKPEPPEPLDFWKPGTRAALGMLKAFATPQNLAKYGKARNDPLADVQSDLSPYIHFGHIAVHRCAMEVFKLKEKTTDKAVLDGVAAFFDEVVVRSQLAENFVFFNPHYDDVKGAPAWAQETLNKHAKDKREPQYDFKSLEEGKTYDDLWNAAQMQLIREGKMHGFLRMYWAKKLLEWTKSPQEALKTALQLNDRYHLDGTDPNGVTGCMWSIGGVHDQGFKERPIFGKIRYMNYQGCERKFDVKTFVCKYPGAAENALSAMKKGLLPPAGKPQEEVEEGSTKNPDRIKERMMKKTEQHAADTKATALPREKKTGQRQGGQTKQERKNSAAEEKVRSEETREMQEADAGVQEVSA